MAELKKVILPVHISVGLGPHPSTNPRGPAMIVTVTPTVGDGTVVRWYFTESDAEQPGVEPAISASRNGVRVGTFLHLVPDDVMATALSVYADLGRDSDADVSHLATHRRRNLFGPLERVPGRD